MNQAALQTASQPLIRLTQSNVELMSRFITSPEVTSQAMNDAQQIFEVAQRSATSLMQSGAYASLLQGLLNNYTEFLTGLVQSSTAIAAELPATLMETGHQVSAAAETVQGNARRAIRAA